MARFLQAAALAFPGIALSLTSGKRKVFAAPAVESVRRRVAAFYGDDLAEDLLETEGGQEGLKVYALLAPPFYSRSNSYSQYTYVNGRFVRDRVLSGAVIAELPGDTRAAPVPDRLRLRHHRAAARSTSTSIRRRWRSASATPAACEAWSGGAHRGAAQGRHHAEDRRAGAPFGTPPRAQSIYRSIEEFYSGRIAARRARCAAGRTGRPVSAGARYRPGAGAAGAVPDAAGGAPMPAPQTLAQGSLIQIRGTYIVQETDQGIAIIDQHALHERIVFAEVRRRLTEGNLQGQRLLIPDVVDVTPEERLAVERSRDAAARSSASTWSRSAEDALAFNCVSGGAREHRQRSGSCATS